MATSKPRIIKDFEKLETNLQEQIKLAYPLGFEENLIHFYDKEGKKITALPFETDDRYYMLRMTREEAKQIIEDDDDFGADGTLKDNIKDNYEDKYGDLNHMSEYLNTDDEEENEDED
jgi:hypothetical protein